MCVHVEKLLQSTKAMHMPQIFFFLSWSLLPFQLTVHKFFVSFKLQGMVLLLRWWDQPFTFSYTGRTSTSRAGFKAAITMFDWFDCHCECETMYHLLPNNFIIHTIFW